MGFGIKLKKILKEKGLTIKELAELSGISINTLYSITKRDTEIPTREIIDKIANALNINDVDLLTYEEFNEQLRDSLRSVKQSEIALRNILYEITEMLNSLALEKLLDSAIDMLQDKNNQYRSDFYKNDKI